MITFYSSGLAQVASGWVGNVGSSRFNSKKGKRAKTKMLTIKKKKKKYLLRFITENQLTQIAKYYGFTCS